MKVEKYYENPEVLSVNTVENRAYYLPHSTKEALFDKSNFDLEANLKGEVSNRVQMLNGDWSFGYYKNVGEVPEGFYTGDFVEEMDIIPVPSCWQIEGYDYHQYANVEYPFPFDPPYVPTQNPAGAYVREFYTTKEQLEGKNYLYFEGVDSCHYVWINGEFVGYSQVSHSSSEFDISDKLKEGKNIIGVLVLKWCDGSYLEDQDKLRMSGIFRDVYIINRPQNHVFDYFVKTHPSDDLSSAEITVDFQAVVGNPEITCRLIDGIYDDDLELETKKVEGNKISFTLNNPRLWNAETPNLYMLIIETKDEVIGQFVGVRKIEIKDGVVYFNNEKIKFRGVNRHDSDPFTGYTISRAQYGEDIAIMQEHNIDSIRTSHYPNAPWFMQMCDYYGMYVMDEADIETHGTTTMYGMGEDTTGIATYSVMPEIKSYEKAFLDRVQKCVIRDKNSPSVFSWSLCNEAGWGPGLQKAGKWVKEYDDTRLVHCESSIYESKEALKLMGIEETKDYYDTSMLDMYSRMYAPIDQIHDYFKEPSKYYHDDAKTKPYVLCEYIHAMGNGPGDAEDYQELIEQYDGFMGGFVWEWTDHGVYMGKALNGKDKYYYGGDFGEFPHSGNFCMDGLVYPDRRIHTGLIDFKNVIRPIRAKAKDLKNGEVVLENKMIFTDAKDRIYGVYEVTKNGEVVDSKPFDLPSIKPGAETVLKLPITLPDDGTVALNLRYFLKEDEIIRGKGHYLGLDQLILQRVPVKIEKEKSGEKISVSKEKNLVTLKGSNFKYVYDEYLGTFSEIINNNENIIEKPIEYNIWRAPTDNDRNIKTRWSDMGYDRSTVRVYSTDINELADGVEITTKLSVGAVYITNILTMDVVWTVSNSGEIDVNVKAKRDVKMPFLPRFGLRLFLSEDFSNVKYLGYGPFESYVDKRRGSHYGKFTSTIFNLHEDYTKPQENGSHYGCDYMSVSKCGNPTLTAKSEDTFSFNISYYTQEELTQKPHNWKLDYSGYAVVCLDYKQSGIGSNSCGPELLEKYRFDEDEFEWNVQLSFK